MKNKTQSVQKKLIKALGNWSGKLSFLLFEISV